MNGDTRLKKAVNTLSSLVYLVASISLLMISLLLITYSLWEVVIAIYNRQPIINVTLDAIGLIVISLAVFDIARYLYEEQVVHDRELRSPHEARVTLTKFLVIVIIAVSLEALVFIFQTGSTDVRNLLYPTALLIASVILVVGMGWYQRLSADHEQE